MSSCSVLFEGPAGDFLENLSEEGCRTHLQKHMMHLADNDSGVAPLKRSRSYGLKPMVLLEFTRKAY